MVEILSEAPRRIIANFKILFEVKVRPDFRIAAIISAIANPGRSYGKVFIFQSVF